MDQKFVSIEKELLALLMTLSFLALVTQYNTTQQATDDHNVKLRALFIRCREIQLKLNNYKENFYDSSCYKESNQMNTKLKLKCNTRSVLRTFKGLLDLLTIFQDFCPAYLMSQNI